MRLIFTAVFLILGTFSFAQITITASDFMGLKGDSAVVAEDTTGFVEVDVGSPGANQTWDFSALNPQGLETYVKFVDPSETPFSDLYPAANIVEYSRFVSDDTTFEGYGYFEINESFLHFLGFVFESMDSVFTEADNDTAPLPLQYGSSWTSINNRIEGGEGFEINIIDTTYTVVDGWGQVTVPAGTFDCLRLRDDYVEIETWKFGDMVVFADTTYWISYQWLTKNAFIVATIESGPDETDPNFTTAEYVSIAQEIIPGSATSIADNKTYRPNDFQLSQNYPNPFNPSTKIRYYLPQASDVRLDIYNQQGELIRSLVNNRQPSGEHIVNWDGRNNSGTRVASGIYYYSLRSKNSILTRPMILLK